MERDNITQEAFLHSETQGFLARFSPRPILESALILGTDPKTGEATDTTLNANDIEVQFLKFDTAPEPPPAIFLVLEDDQDA